MILLILEGKIATKTAKKGIQTGALLATTIAMAVSAFNSSKTTIQIQEPVAKIEAGAQDLNEQFSSLLPQLPQINEAQKEQTLSSSPVIDNTEEQIPENKPKKVVINQIKARETKSNPKNTAPQEAQPFQLNSKKQTKQITVQKMRNITKLSIKIKKKQLRFKKNQKS